MGAGAASLGTFQKKEAAAAPGPPFPANSAANGLSVDGGTGQIVLGSTSGTGPGAASDFTTAREIYMDGLDFFLYGQNASPDYILFTNNAFQVVDGVSGAKVFIVNSLIQMTDGSVSDTTLRPLRLGMDDGLGITSELTSPSLLFNDVPNGNASEMFADHFRVAGFGGIALLNSDSLTITDGAGKKTEMYPCEIDFTDPTTGATSSWQVGLINFIDPAGNRSELNPTTLTMQDGATGDAAELSFPQLRISDGTIETLYKKDGLRIGQALNRVADIDLTTKNVLLGDVDDTTSGIKLRILPATGQILAQGLFSVFGALENATDVYLIRMGTALPNGAAAALGTLTNAPAAGNPTKWVPFNDAGTVRYIPTW